MKTMNRQKKVKPREIQILASHKSVAMVTLALAKLLRFCYFLNVPTEILEYCKVLDLDPVTEKDLMYIAREGIKAPLPDQWKPV